MKTQKAEKPILSLKKLVYTVAVIAAFSFLNCLTARAMDNYSQNQPVRFIDNMSVDAQSRFQVYDWMFNFRYEMLSVIIRNRVLRDYRTTVQGVRYNPHPTSHPIIEPNVPPKDPLGRCDSMLPVKL